MASLIQDQSSSFHFLSAFLSCSYMYEASTRERLGVGQKTYSLLHIRVRMHIVLEEYIYTFNLNEILLDFSHMDVTIYYIFYLSLDSSSHQCSAQINKKKRKEEDTIKQKCHMLLSINKKRVLLLLESKS